MRRYIKAVGSGQKRARSLTRDEARAAMQSIAEGRCEPIQLGAFLLALRMKGESADELAGFADALLSHAIRFAAPAGALDVDGHGDGHEGLVSLLPAAMCATASLGVPVCLHLESAAPFARHGLDAGLAAIGLGGALDPARAERDLHSAGVAACDLALACPPLARLVALRPLLGVRTVAQTLAKLVSPSTARRHLVGIFHAPYLEPTAAALGQLGIERGVVAQALGGLPEARPGKITRIADAATARATPFDLREFSSVSHPVNREPADQPAPGQGATSTGAERTQVREPPPRLLLRGNPPRSAGATQPWGRMVGRRSIGALTAGDSPEFSATPSAAASIDERAPLGGAKESVAANRAALDGEPMAARAAAATAALMLFAAGGGDPRALAEAALGAFANGRARAVAERLGR